MDKDKQKQSLYPTATRGVLANEQVHKTYKAGPINRVRDYSPTTIILQAVVICILIGAGGIGTYIYYYAKIRKASPHTVAFAVAKKVSELKTTQTYDNLEYDTDIALKTCKAPIITITHDYSQPGQTRKFNTTVIDTGNIKTITPLLEELVDKSDGATKNTMEINCP